MATPTIITFADDSETHHILSTHIIAISRLPATENHPERTRVDYSIGQAQGMMFVVNDTRDEYDRNVALWRVVL